jgi:actin-like ATPase involved in cell morphogenesis
MTREDFDRATELMGEINKRKNMIDDINNGTIEIGISVDGFGVSRINRYINDTAYKMICDMVTNIIKQDLADMEKELSEL